MTEQRMAGVAQQIANDRYKDLAAQYGDLSFRKFQIETEQADVLEQMRMINAAVPSMLRVEGDVVKAIQAATAEAEKAKQDTVGKVVEVMKHEQSKHPSRNP